MCALDECRPCGHSGIGNRGCNYIIEIIWEWNAMLGAYQRSLCKSSKRCFRKGEVDPLSIVGEAYAIDSSDGREGAIRTVVGTGRPRFGDLAESGGLHLDDGESVSGNRFGEVLVHRMAAFGAFTTAAFICISLRRVARGQVCPRGDLNSVQ